MVRLKLGYEAPNTTTPLLSPTRRTPQDEVAALMPEVFDNKFIFIVIKPMDGGIAITEIMISSSLENIVSSSGRKSRSRTFSQYRTVSNPQYRVLLILKNRLKRFFYVEEA